jgi:heptaprenyl diphosphate synthase
MKTKKLAEMSMLTAVSLILFIVELRFPDIIPVYGVKLGLANIITVYAVYRFRAGETAMIVLVRVLLGAIFGGNISAIIYSMSGAAMCLVGMLLIRRIIPKNYIWLCSIFGAIFHNIGQICAAVFVTKSMAVISYLPVMTAAGCIAGLFTGLCAQIIVKRIQR